MVPEDLLFWIAPMSGTPHDDQNVLCLRHADAMSVPRGWTLDDRREEVPRLFMPRRPRSATPERRPVRPPRPSRAKRAPRPEPVEQLVIDGTGEIERPTLPPESAAAAPAAPATPAKPAASVAPKVADPEPVVEVPPEAIAVTTGAEATTVDTGVTIEVHRDASGAAADDAGRPADRGEPAATDAPEAPPWRPSFDEGNNLDGLLEVSSPLLARAFRGTDRPRG